MPPVLEQLHVQNVMHLRPIVTAINSKIVKNLATFAHYVKYCILALDVIIAVIIMKQLKTAKAIVALEKLFVLNVENIVDTSQRISTIKSKTYSYF